MPQWTRRSFPCLKSVTANCLPTPAHLHVHVWTPSPGQNDKEGFCANTRPDRAERIPCKSPPSKRAFVYVWTLCVSKVLCMLLHTDMNSRFILSACAVSDFAHFTGHPAVQLHCTRTLQFVSKRFPKSQNISSAVQCAPRMQKRWSEKLGCAWSPVAWPATAMVREWF